MLFTDDNKCPCDPSKCECCCDCKKGMKESKKTCKPANKSK